MFIRAINDWFALSQYRDLPYATWNLLRELNIRLRFWCILGFLPSLYLFRNWINCIKGICWIKNVPYSMHYYTTVQFKCWKWKEGPSATVRTGGEISPGGKFSSLYIISDLIRTLRHLTSRHLENAMLSTTISTVYMGWTHYFYSDRQTVIRSADLEITIIFTRTLQSVHEKNFWTKRAGYFSSDQTLTQHWNWKPFSFYKNI